MINLLLFRVKILKVLNFVFIGGERVPNVNKFVFKLILRAVKSEYGFDLREEVHNHRGVEMKRMLVNFLLDYTGWSQSKTFRFLIECGVEEKGATRRTISYYKNSHNQMLSLSGGSSDNLRYNKEYVSLCNKIKSLI